MIGSRKSVHCLGMLLGSLGCLPRRIGGRDTIFRWLGTTELCVFTCYLSPGRVLLRKILNFLEFVLDTRI